MYVMVLELYSLQKRPQDGAHLEPLVSDFPASPSLSSHTSCAFESQPVICKPSGLILKDLADHQDISPK